MRTSDTLSPSVLAESFSRVSVSPAVRDPSAALRSAIDGRWVVGLGLRPTRFQAIDSVPYLQRRVALYPHGSNRGPYGDFW